MSLRFINIGYGDMVQANRILSVTSPDTVATKRLLAIAQENNLFQDSTFGRKPRAILWMDNGLFIASAVNTETIIQRIHGFGAVAVGDGNSSESAS